MSNDENNETSKISEGNGSPKSISSSSNAEIIDKLDALAETQAESNRILQMLVSHLIQSSLSPIKEKVIPPVPPQTKLPTTKDKKELHSVFDDDDEDTHASDSSNPNLSFDITKNFPLPRIGPKSSFPDEDPLKQSLDERNLAEFRPVSSVMETREPFIHRLQKSDPWSVFVFLRWALEYANLYKAQSFKIINYIDRDIHDLLTNIPFAPPGINLHSLPNKKIEHLLKAQCIPQDSAEKLKALMEVEHPVPEACAPSGYDAVKCLIPAFLRYHTNFRGFAAFLMYDQIGGTMPALATHDNSLIALHKKGLTESLRLTVWVYVKDLKIKFQSFEHYAQVFLKMFQLKASDPAVNEPTLIHIMRYANKDRAAMQEIKNKSSTISNIETVISSEPVANLYALQPGYQQQRSSYAPPPPPAPPFNQQFHQYPSTQPTCQLQQPYTQQFSQQPQHATRQPTYQPTYIQPTSNQYYASESNQPPPPPPTHQTPSRILPRPPESQPQQQRSHGPFAPPHYPELRIPVSEQACYATAYGHPCKMGRNCIFNHSPNVINAERHRISQLPPMIANIQMLGNMQYCIDSNLNQATTNTNDTSKDDPPTSEFTPEELYNIEMKESRKSVSFSTPDSDADSKAKAHFDFLRSQLYTDPQAHGIPDTGGPRWSDRVPSRQEIQPRFRDNLNAILKARGQDDYMDEEELKIFDKINSMTSPTSTSYPKDKNSDLEPIKPYFNILPSFNQQVTTEPLVDPHGSGDHVPLIGAIQSVDKDYRLDPQTDNSDCSTYLCGNHSNDLVSSISPTSVEPILC